jgi:hypothetical protein
MDSVSLKTESIQDKPVYRAFGLSGDCTDGWDIDHETLAPFFPPAPSFFVVFTSEDILPRLYADPMQSDCRGIPDSVKTGAAMTFSVRYELKFQRGYGNLVTIVFPPRLARGIDSIRIEDVEGLGSIFRHTYSGGGGADASFTIQNTALRYFYLTAYYNVQTAGVGHEDAPVIANDLRIYPNPATSGSQVNFTVDAPAGSRLVVSDMLGQVVASQSVVEGARSFGFDPGSISAGLYMARLVDERGQVLRSGRLTVLR